MIKIQTDVIRVSKWEKDIVTLLGFDVSLFTTEPIPVEDAQESTYESYVDYLISKHSTAPSVYFIIKGILEDIVELYEARGLTISCRIEPATPSSYITVIAYQE